MVAQFMNIIIYKPRTHNLDYVQVLVSWSLGSSANWQQSFQEQQSNLAKFLGTAVIFSNVSRNSSHIQQSFQEQQSYLAKFLETAVKFSKVSRNISHIQQSFQKQQSYLAKFLGTAFIFSKASRNSSHIQQSFQEQQSYLAKFLGTIVIFSFKKIKYLLFFHTKQHICISSRKLLSYPK